VSGRSRYTPGQDGFGAGLNMGPAQGFARDSTVGKIEMLAGSCTVTRANGIFVLAKVGDFVFCGDVIETAEDGCVGIRFVDGTAFSLSSNARMRLKEFNRDSGAPSASFDISRGRFAFIAGEIAKAGRFAIDTPFGSIQGRARSSGIGTLSLAALFLAAMEEVQASSNIDGLLSNGILSLDNANESNQLNSFLSYGDGDKLHGFLSYGKIPYAGFFELTLHGPNSRQIIVDDPSVTVVIRPGSSEVEYFQNTPQQMAQLQEAQKEALKIFTRGLLQGPTGFGQSGSSTPPNLLFQGAEPINFIPSGNNVPTSTFANNSTNGATTTTIGLEALTGSGAPAKSPSPINELHNVTGDLALDSTSGTLPFIGTNLSASAGAPTFVWSSGALSATQETALAAASMISFSGSGPIDFTYSAPDSAFDFLAQGETLTVTYNVTTTGSNGPSSHLVTIPITGSNDAPIITSTAPSQALTEGGGVHGSGGESGTESTSGTISFTDVDLTDTHTASFAAQGAGYLGTFTLAPITQDSGNGGTGQLGWSFSVDNSAIDYLAAGESLVQHYNVMVDDGHGGTAVQTVTVTINGANDAPMITSTAPSQAVTEDGGVPGSGGESGTESTSGAISFTDVDFIDTHTASFAAQGTGYLGTFALAPITQDSGNGGTGQLGWSFSVDNSAIDYLAAGESLVQHYNVTIDDGHGGTNSQLVTVTINGTNDVPVIGGVHTGSVTEDVAVDGSGNLTTGGALTISDVDQGQSNFTAQAATLGSYGTFTLDAAGNWTYTADDSQTAIQQLGATQSITDSFTAVSSDGTNSQLVTVTINGTNDAPVLLDKSPVLDAENQGAGAPVGAVGTLVSSLVSLSGGIANVTDADNGAVTGIALTATDTTNGIWWYSTNDGTTWTLVGSVTDSTALLLAADGSTRLYFQPNASYSGTDTNAITFRAWDQTFGHNGDSGIDTSITNAFSTASDSASITIYPIDTTPPAFADNINIDGNYYEFTGYKTNLGNYWQFQVAVTDDDATYIGQGGIVKFELYDLHDGATSPILLGSATFDTSSGTWTGDTFIGSVTYANGVYTITTTYTTEIKNHDTLTVTAYDAASLSSTSTPAYLTNNSSFAVAPAGIAGEPINLALTDPSGGQAVGPIEVTIANVPTDWSLNQGTSNGDGTWTVETNDLSALSVLTAAAYAGATVLNVTETWSNADGSVGNATIADNVEAFTIGSPIFAWSGNDTLTGSSANDLFVFEQPIGTDVVHNFDVVHDQVDLIGYPGFSSFADVQAHLATDVSGNAVLTLGVGQSITFAGVEAGSLTAADFVFDHEPVTNNTGSMAISDGALLPISGTVNNTGTITLNSTGDQTELQILGHGVTLTGGGQLILSDSLANAIVGTNPADTLTNVDNIISGAGHIGGGDGTLTLVNEAQGTIDANMSGATLALTTGVTITNNGILEATNGGILAIEDPVIGSGSAIIAGGTIAIGAQSNLNVTFDNGQSGATYGELILADASHFSGHISGFAGTAPDPAHSDVIDLVGINYNSLLFSETYDASTGLLTVTDGSNSAGFMFDNFDGVLKFSSDGNGGTLITDPPATNGTTTNDAQLATHDRLGLFGSRNTDPLTGNSHHDKIIGGSVDTTTSWSGTDSFVFKHITDSQSDAGHFYTIPDFRGGVDHVDFAAISGLNSDNQTVSSHELTSTPASIAAHCIDIVTNNGDTTVYANASGATQEISNADIEIHLTQVADIRPTDFIIHH